MPNLVNLAKWADALESGEYEQGSHALRYGNRHCCLGVACELAIRDGVPVEVGRYSMNDDLHTYDGESGGLPERVQEWLGVEHRDVPIGAYRSAVSMNDFQGASFREIAAAIREEYGIVKEGA